VIWLSKDGGITAEEKPLVVFTQGMYLFDQSDPSNVGNTLVIGQTLDLTPYYTTNVITNGIAGSPNAYTLIDLSGQTLPSPDLKYFSQQTAGMGHRFSIQFQESSGNFKYIVTVAGGVFWLSKDGGITAEEQPLVVFTRGMYLFDQSDPSNAGNTLVIGQTLDSTPYYYYNVVTNGVAGSPNAYTLIDLSGQTLPSPALKYFSQQTAGMGHSYSIQFQDLLGSNGTPITLSNISLTYPLTVEFEISFIDDPPSSNGVSVLNMVGLPGAPSSSPTNTYGVGFQVVNTVRNIMLILNETIIFTNDAIWAVKDDAGFFNYINFVPQYGRNKWNHVAFCVSDADSSPKLFINGQNLRGGTRFIDFPWGKGLLTPSTSSYSLNFPGTQHGICNLQYRNIRVSNIIRYDSMYTVPRTFPSDSYTVFSMDMSGNTIRNSKSNSITLANFNVGSSF
jgi:hypothetical protein